MRSGFTPKVISGTKNKDIYKFMCDRDILEASGHKLKFVTKSVIIHLGYEM